MTYRMFVDDVRDPEWTYPDDAEGWVVVRDYTSAVALVCQHGWPNHVSFDHDLGTGPSGYDFAHWLVQHDLEHGGMPADFSYRVHSANPIGAVNIHGLVSGYLRSR